MSYIQNNLQAGEEIKYKADIHWYIFAYPVILLLLSAFFSSAQTGLFYYVSIFLLLSEFFLRWELNMLSQTRKSF